MDEFALIRRYFARLTSAAKEITLGIGDDCALITPPAGEELAITTDTLIEGRHFPFATDPSDIGWKALAVNLSDLAAMGARPLAFQLALTLPDAKEAWLEKFAQGLGELATSSGISLTGGDTTRGTLSITITAIGALPAGSALRRDSARAGDKICVTGTLGDAALGLKVLPSYDASDLRQNMLRRRLDRPTPRLEVGQALRGIANAAIDLSDGLAGDLMHILDASQVGAEIDAGLLPMSAEFLALHAVDERLALQASGGDDYELCLCIPPEKLALARQRTNVLLTEIGTITAAPGLRWRGLAGSRGVEHGYQHF